MSRLEPHLQAYDIACTLQHTRSASQDMLVPYNHVRTCVHYEHVHVHVHVHMFSAGLQRPFITEARLTSSHCTFESALHVLWQRAQVR